MPGWAGWASLDGSLGGGAPAIGRNIDGRLEVFAEAPGATDTELAHIWPGLKELTPKIAEQLEIDAKYDVYLARQSADIAAFRRDEALGLPEDLDYRALKGLSNEVRHKLALLRPRTIGQAARIDGITPAAVMLLLAHIRRKQPTSAAPARPSSAR